MREEQLNADLGLQRWRYMTSRTLLSILKGLLIASTLGIVACASKVPPRSTTTTRTQSSTQFDSGNSQSSDTKETTIQQADGSSTVQRTETTKTSPRPQPK
jgi:ABC-type phosphate transport system substrate-binding protein